MQMNTELARQRAHIGAVRARIATGRPRPAPVLVALDGPLRYDHVRVWRRVERARRDKGPRVDDVVEAACEAWNTTRDELFVRRRDDDRALRRQVVMHLCWRRSFSPLPDVGARLERDHATILHADRVVRARLDAGDAVVTEMVAGVLAYLGLDA